ncbi:winged helix-turn-helix domain-containing protein [Actinoplanes sp. LDG1-06]|uniref:Winged helix-turn-helix domain-containing protein n=1 Tax=Paractinoplanes ovalisporus TaxID=2810368 RepID=A0ABS2AVC5_9ACTN|nr:BTAD domain-containing putative transcriptional regulator [Actinoplanes ovalisporus]MBM2623784.1 winged helix-turn-helix domain-containing protein [Actinoplanes ovalisporus]
MRIALLGSPAVTAGERRLRIAGEKQHALLALLALNAGRVVPADRLIDGLWGDGGPQDRPNALQHQVSRLRALLGGDRVVRRDPGYRLDVPPDDVDVHRFERLAREGRAALRAGDPREAADCLRAGLALWRGAALAGLPSHPWVQAEAARLDRLRLDVIEDRVDADLALGAYDELAGELETLVAEHPYRERLWGQLMLAQHRRGRQTEALETFQRARRVLAGDYGLDPGPELQRIQADVLAPAPARAGGNLPAPLTSLVGRHHEVMELGKRLHDARLLTLTGPPGVGKTRLAVEVAGLASGEFPGGAWLVELAPLTDPAAVTPAVAAALAVRAPDGDLVAHLRDRQALLLLDNCEHLLPGLAALVAQLLAACPRLQVLATSREPLGLTGEAQWPVPPLTLPEAGAREPGELLGSEAVRLFEERAAGALPSFTVTADNARAIGEVCRRLDGLPLAIELAAARVRALPVTHIAAGLDDRFRLLVAHRRTLRATLDWSYDLLDARERAAFPALSVFAGGFSLEAAEAVGAGRDEVTGLVDKSLLTAGTDPDGQPRFGMLETIRAYGRKHRSDGGAAARAHRGFFVRFAEAAEAGLRHADYRGWHRRVTAEYENLRTAFDGALADGDTGSTLRLAASLWLFWGAADRHAEGCAWLEAALAVAPEPGPAAWVTLSYLAGQRHDVERAVDAGERALALALAAGDEWETARARQTLALVLGAAGRPERAATLLAEARVTILATGDDFWAASSDLIAATGAVRAGRLDEAGRLGHDILARARRCVYEPFECWARLLLAAAARQRVTAASELREALRVARRLELPHYVAFVRTELGRLAVLDGDLDRARSLLTDAVREAEAGDSRWQAALARCGLAEALLAGGDVEAAETLFGEVRAWAESPGARRTRATFFTALGGSPYGRCLLGLARIAEARGARREAAKLRATAKEWA